jgi:M6 family metalloprotease-like protein
MRKADPMKKRLFVLLFLAILLLGGCDFFTRSTTLAPAQTTESTTPVMTDLTPTVPLTVTTTPLTTTTTTAVTTTTTVPSSFVLSEYETIQDQLEVVGLPSTGQIKTLVFAVDFSDHTQANAGITLADLELAFNGTPDEVDYESVRSYYRKSSVNQLDLSADIYGFYRAEYPSTWYEDEYEKLYATDIFGNYIYDEEDLIYPDSLLIGELLSYYDEAINYADYDTNHDGYIDGLYIVYTTPVSFDNGSDLWWAYQDTYAYEGNQFDAVEPYYFVWGGSDFLWENDDHINARTWIHETGHLLGLEDYYDYDESDRNNSGGLGGADMMDDTFGDHNPFSKLMLGWITPTVITGTAEIDLAAYATTNQVLLITDRWYNTIFDEYLLVCFSTSEGLFSGIDNQIFTSTGILIYHVDARIGHGYLEDSAYYTIYDYNNTDTAHKLLKIIEADEDGDIDRYSRAENSDLFQTGDVFRSTVCEDYAWYVTMRNPINFTVQIDSISVISAHLSIDFSD